jgi:hypothetical protein
MSLGIQIAATHSSFRRGDQQSAALNPMAARNQPRGIEPAAFLSPGITVIAIRLCYRLSTDRTSRTLYNFLWSAAGVGSGETTARILHWFSAGESTVPGIPQTFSISVIAFTGKKFRSHSPALHRLPLYWSDFRYTSF